MVAILLALLVGAGIGFFAAALLHHARLADDSLESLDLPGPDDITEAIAH